MSIRIDISGVEGAAKMFDNVAKTTEELKMKLPILMAEIIIYEARSNLQNNQSIFTGDLHASIRILEQQADGSIVVGTDKWYAKWVEYGRGLVFAKPGKVLHWIGKSGEHVFAKSVGPAPPRPFFWPAVHVALRKIKAMTRDLISRQV